IAALAGIDELQIDVLADAFQIAVVPYLERIGRRRTATLFHGPLVLAAGGMRLLIVRWPPRNIDVAAVRQIAGLAGGEVVVGIRDAGKDLVAVFIVRGIRVGIPPAPEVLDEGVALLIVRQVLEGLALGVRDNPVHVLIEPLLVVALQFLLKFLLLLEFLVVAEAALAGVGLRLDRLRLVDAIGVAFDRRRRVLAPRDTPSSGSCRQHCGQSDGRNRPTLCSHILLYSCCWDPLLPGSRPAAPSKMRPRGTPESPSISYCAT